MVDNVKDQETSPAKKLEIPAHKNQLDMPRLGEILVAHGLITSKQLETALVEQKETRKYIGVILMRHKWISERDLIDHLCRQRNVEFYNVHDMEIPFQIYQQIPRDVAIKNQVLPIAVQKDTLFVAIEDPFDRKTIAKIEEVINKSIVAGFGLRSDLQYALNRLYNNLVRANKNLRDFYDGFAYLLEKSEFDAVRVIDLLLALGYLLKASDIHLTFGKNDFLLSVRIDGNLHSVPLPARRLTSDQITHLRNTMMIKGDIDTSKRSQPQIGRLELMMEQTTVKARLATFPLFDGEKAVLRFMGMTQRRTMDTLGLEDVDIPTIRKIISDPAGLIVVASPAGNGKSTTLYTLLSNIPHQTKNIFTIEDSIEANLPLVSQTLVSRKGPNTYESALENIGPQDTDVIMIGSLDNDKVIKLTMELAMADNIVLTALPMDNVAHVIMYLLRSGVDPLSVASTLKLVISQRLVPLICQKCKKPHPKSVGHSKRLGIPEDSILHYGEGCQSCYFTGTSGRTMLFQTIIIDEKLSELISSDPTFSVIANYLKETNRYGFRRDAIRKCKNGLIQPRDVLKYS